MYGQLLDSQVPLKPGEVHCLYCNGYGANPIDKTDNGWYRFTQFVPPKCTRCDGTGKESK